MKFYTVDIKNITCDTLHDNFSVVELENMADLIIESGGLIRPLILKNIGLESFAVIDGHFEYYAAVRAREKNPRQCEMVNAFIIPPKNEEILSKQIAVFKKFDLYSSEIENNPAIRLKDVEPSSANNEISLLTQQMNDLKTELAQEKQENQKLYDSLKSLESQNAKLIKPLDIFNDFNVLDLTLKLRDAKFADKRFSDIVKNIDDERKKQKFESLNDVVERVKIQSAKAQKKEKVIASKKMVTILDNWLSREMKLLDIFNEFSLAELTLRLKIGTGFSDNKVSQIVGSIDKERKKKSFESLNDVVERVKIKHGKRDVKGITSDKMVTIIDIWSHILFR